MAAYLLYEGDSARGARRLRADLTSVRMVGLPPMSDPTRADLLPLLDLQQIDSAVDRLVHRRANLPEQAELDTLQAQRIEDAAVHAEQDEELGKLVREMTRLETDTQMIVDRIVHEQMRLDSGSVTSPREMANISAELDSLQRRKSHLEDQEIEVMERREELEKVVGDLAGALADLDAKMADAAQRRDAAAAAIDAELGELRAKREALTGSMHDEVIERYEQVRAKQGGIGAAAIDKGTCRACSLPLSPMQREDIRTSDEVFIRCENCRRILVITE